MQPEIFLRAEWRKLAIVNYSVDRRLLEKYIPHHTEIDLWNNTCYLSLVGFMFQQTRVKGFKIPFHVNFEEVNLRFYVRYKDGGEWKRGVTFIKEIVPKAALSIVANMVYKEHYETMPMRHSWETSPGALTVEYQWKKKRWNTFSIVAGDMSEAVKRSSEEEFITDHLWGYTRLDDRRTMEYEVKHPMWDVYPTRGYVIDIDFADIYGSSFHILQDEKPASVFLAEGSVVEVMKGRQI
jgi:uncharacterized protein YqjF (DUF2071 family)